MRQVLRREDAQGPEKNLLRGREPLFLAEKRGSLPLAPSFPKNRSQDCLHRRQSFFVAAASQRAHTPMGRGNACSTVAAQSNALPSPHVFPGSSSSHRLTGKSFWKGRVRGGRTFFQKGFPPHCFFLASNLHRSPAVLPSRASNLHQLPAACPARKIPPKKRLPTLGRSFGDDRPVELALPCLEGRGIRGWRSMAGVQQPVPQQKNPRRTGDKKRPPRAESCKGVFEQSLAAAYFPT